MPHPLPCLPLGLLLVTLGLAASEHGMYRGPDNNGIYPATGLLRR